MHSSAETTASAAAPRATKPEFERLAERLRELRRERGQTLDELATLSGLSKAYLSRIESAERQPSLGALVTLARMWDVPMAAFFVEVSDRSVTRLRRRATAEWLGDSGGEGAIRVQSGAFEGAYSQRLRVEGKGINPEELVAAAQAGCFSMKLVSLLTEAGTPPARVTTDVDLDGEFSDAGFRITRLDVTCLVNADGLSPAALRESAALAKRLCPVSRALAGVDISVRAELD